MVQITCRTCAVEFSERKQAQEHYSGKWHQNNFTRKGKNMSPLTENEYNDMLQKSIFLTKGRNEANLISCKACKKNFLSQGSFETHQKSKKHRQNLARKAAENIRRLKIQLQKQVTSRTAGEVLSVDQTTKIDDNSIVKKGTQYCTACKESFTSAKAYASHADTFKHRKALKLMQLAAERKEELINQDKAQAAEKEMDDDDMEVEEVDSDEWDEDAEGADMEEGEDDSQPLPLSVCLLCGKKSKDLENNLGHMERTHSFIVPHKGAGDLEQLQQYLGEKIGVGHQCLECSKPFQSLAACRKHMLMKPHLAIRFEGEYDRFFDVSKIMAKVQLPPKPAENDLFCFPLPDGSMLTHRDLRKYFRQRLSSNVRPIRRIASSRIRAITHLGKASSTQSLVEFKSEQKKIARDINIQQTKHKRKQLDVNVKANKLQHHFRLQVQNAG